jgi:hypothetical protein
MKISIRPGQPGFGAEYIRTQNFSRPARVDDWGCPVGPIEEFGPQLFRVVIRTYRPGSDPSRPDVRTDVYESVPDDGREAVEIYNA